MSPIVRSPEADEALISAAQDIMNQGGKIRSERVCYYRTPKIRVDGQAHTQAGWIGWDQTQQNIQLQKIGRGYIPLRQYGFIEAKPKDEYPDGPYEMYGPWGQLLSNPEGVKELPADQIIAYFWYDENVLRNSLNGNIPPTLRVKNGLVMWPQLKGMNLKVYACPECGHIRFNEAIHLARHLRLWHDYDRADIIAFGKENGVDFSTQVIRGGKVFQGYSFENVEPSEFIPESNDADDPGFALELAKPRGKSKG